MNERVAGFTEALLVVRHWLKEARQAREPRGDALQRVQARLDQTLELLQAGLAAEVEQELKNWSK
ncbi:MAG: hypothetical protein M1357_00670 [Candidatus Marsarchaeota archaeon]|nr:hypothetical protein [Candidatus Marsarchaeota archaeon]